MERLAIVGAGGHAKVVLATARAAGHRDVRLLDDDPDGASAELLGLAVSGPAAEALDDPEALAVIAVGDNAARRDLAARARCGFAALVHPAAHVHESAVVGPGTVVFAGAVVQPGAAVGAHAIVNTGATVDHDCTIGDFSHVAPGVSLSGAVTIGEGTLVGVGSAACPGVSVGAWTTVGAGSAITRDLPGGITAVGSPARALPAR